MKLKFVFRQKFIIYEVYSQLFGASSESIQLVTINKFKAEQAYKHYTTPTGDPYEVFDIRERLGYCHSKKLK